MSRRFNSAEAQRLRALRRRLGQAVSDFQRYEDKVMELRSCRAKVDRLVGFLVGLGHKPEEVQKLLD